MTGCGVLERIANLMFHVHMVGALGGGGVVLNQLFCLGLGLSASRGEGCAS